MEDDSRASMERESLISGNWLLPFSAGVFDVSGTLVQIGQRQSPYRALMHWMRVADRRPQPDDAARIMTQRVELADVGNLFGVPLPHDLVAASQAAQQTELNAPRIGRCRTPRTSGLHRATFGIWTRCTAS